MNGEGHVLGCLAVPQERAELSAAMYVFFERIQTSPNIRHASDIQATTCMHVKNGQYQAPTGLHWAERLVQLH